MYGPYGMAASGTLNLQVEELEALRLCDMEGLGQESAAKQMEVSRQTLGRILSSARQKIATAIVEGKAVRVSGGEYQFPEKMHRRRQRGRHGS